MTTSEARILYKELSYEIINAAFAVHNSLGPGFSERIYEEALRLELQQRNIMFERQKPINVYYRDVKIGEYVLDVVVAGKVILELKATTEHNSLFQAKLYSYLKATGLRLGLLINFGMQKLSHKRVVN
jgi:GxxExxY protein